MIGEDKVYCAIYKTTDYSKFKNIVGNRQLNRTNFAKLLQSMKEKQLIIPILVNEKMEIIDGQHRAKCCEQLGLPIYYYVQERYSIEEVNRANVVSSNWKKDDYLHMFLAKEKIPYVVLNDIYKRYNIPIMHIIRLFGIVQSKPLARMNYEFDNGLFTDDGAMEVMNILDALEDFSFFEGYKTKSFLGAFIKLYFQDSYDHQEMKKQLEKSNFLLDKRRSVDDYLVLLCNKMYSFGKRQKLMYNESTKTFHN